MDPRLLRYYNQELRYLREMGAEFAQAFPKIAGRLGMEGMEVADPYVERLLEGCAFLAARVQLKQDAEFPQLSQQLLEMVSPNLGAPMPSMLVAQITPGADPNLVAGLTLPRGTTLTGPATALSATRCEFQTAQSVVLTPLVVTCVQYFSTVPQDLPLSSLGLPERPRSGVRVQLELPVGLSVAQLALDDLRFYIGGLGDVARRLHELITCAGVGVLVGEPSRSRGRAEASAYRFLEASAVKAVGYDDADAMLPVTLRGLSGTRLMQEFFAFAQRFMFIDVCGLSAALKACSESQVELVFLFNRHDAALEGSGEPANFALHCVPAINLFERRAGRIDVDDSQTAFHVVPDRMAVADHEVFDVRSLQGFAEGGEPITFLPLFAVPKRDPAGAQGFYSTVRKPRLLPGNSQREGPRSAYVGSEVYASIVDLKQAPYRDGLRQLSARVRCTNRDLPLFMPTSSADWVLQTSAPVAGIAVLAGPSRPYSAPRDGGVAWRLLSLLSLNHLSLVDQSPEEGALALRELLELFAPAGDVNGLRRQIEGVRRVAVKPVVRRHPVPGPIAFGRGLEVTVTVDEMAFEGSSAVLLGSVLHRHLARHVSMNSFVRTVLVSQSRGVLMTWGALSGARALL
jgi:type VI secretion system protein ImpG